MKPSGAERSVFMKRSRVPVSAVSGPGLTPAAALGVGLKVDADALSPATLDAIRRGRVNLNDPAVTLALLEANAVVGVSARRARDGGLQSVGIQCALCHSTTTAFSA
jgi:hypothetical protein